MRAMDAAAPSDAAGKAETETCSHGNAAGSSKQRQRKGAAAAAAAATAAACVAEEPPPQQLLQSGAGSDDDDDDEDASAGGPPPHPYGVQPWGNFYLSRVPEIRTAGLGPLLCQLPDEVVLGLLYLLPAPDLARLGLASRALYCFAHTHDLWKSLVLQELGGDFDWRGSWRETYLTHAVGPPRYEAGSHRPLRVSGFYSDFLHQPWLCATVGLQPAWLEVDNIDRRSGLTAAQFRAQYEAPNRPVLLTDGAAGWPALTKWSPGYLAAALAGRPVIVGNTSWRFGSYLKYCQHGAADDEMPVYLFDKAFASACPQLVGDYRVPDVFSEDLFEVLGEEGRPDYRWLIVGPHRSGSSFHVDPNATCAWNACVSGAKKWILFPPGCPPPGVYPSPDGADVAAPVSIIEWFLNFYDEARAAKVPPIECICRPGEVLFVPRGWWHCVLNLGPHCVAVTQNYVSSTGLGAVLEFLRPGRAELVSGCCAADRAGLHDRFVAALRAQRPEVLAALEAAQQRQREARQAEARLAQLFRGAGGGGAGDGGGGGGSNTRCSQPPQQQGQQEEQVQQQVQEQEQQRNAAGALGRGGPGGLPGFSFGFQLAAAPASPEGPETGGGGATGQGVAAAPVGFSFGLSVEAAECVATRVGDGGGEASEQQQQDAHVAAAAAAAGAAGQQQQQQQDGRPARGARGADSGKRPRMRHSQRMLEVLLHSQQAGNSTASGADSHIDCVTAAWVGE